MPPSEYYTPLDHSCDAWQAQDSIIPNNINVPSDDESYFYIKIMVDFSIYFEDEDGLLMTDESSEHVEEFLEPLEQLMQNKNEASWPSISRMLSSVHVPIDIQPNMVHRISKCALSMAREAHNVGCRVLPMVVSIHVVEVDEDEDGDEAAATAAATAAASSFVLRQEMAASKEWVEGLETVRVAEGSRGGCVICQEEVVKGCEVKRMPCGHDYHWDCIVKWLGVSNFCPLCRFQLPT